MDKPTKRSRNIGSVKPSTGEADTNDVIVDEIRRVREELINRCGGIDGYFKHCQAQERARASRAKPRRRKRPARAARKMTKAK